MLYISSYVLPRDKKVEEGDEDIRISTGDWRVGCLHEENHEGCKRVRLTVMK